MQKSDRTNSDHSGSSDSERRKVSKTCSGVKTGHLHQQVRDSTNVERDCFLNCHESCSSLTAKCWTDSATVRVSCSNNGDCVSTGNYNRLHTAWEDLLREHKTLNKLYANVVDDIQRSNERQVTTDNRQSVIEPGKDDLLEKLKTSQSKCQYLQSRIQRLHEENKKIAERSKMITLNMADRFEKGATMELLNDEYSNTKLATGFGYSLNGLWVDICEELQDNSEHLSELESLTAISNIMQEIDKRCTKKAEQYLRQILFLDSDDVLPKHEMDKEVFAMRKRLGQNLRVIKKIQGEVCQLDEFYNQNAIFAVKSATDKMKTFIEEFAKYSWLFSIATPQVKLNFQVIGKQIETVQKHFVEFSTQHCVSVEGKSPGTIVLVAWPSVELENGASVWSKGEVVVNK